jgi:hypothetical protein
MLTSLGLKPGDVFTWDNYPFNAATQAVKKRWLILLGYFVSAGNPCAEFFLKCEFYGEKTS